MTKTVGSALKMKGKSILEARRVDVAVRTRWSRSHVSAWRTATILLGLGTLLSCGVEGPQEVLSRSDQADGQAGSRCNTSLAKTGEVIIQRNSSTLLGVGDVDANQIVQLSPKYWYLKDRFGEFFGSEDGTAMKAGDSWVVVPAGEPTNGGMDNADLSDELREALQNYENDRGSQSLGTFDRQRVVELVEEYQSIWMSPNLQWSSGVTDVQGRLVLSAETRLELVGDVDLKVNVSCFLDGESVRMVRVKGLSGFDEPPSLEIEILDPPSDDSLKLLASSIGVPRSILE